jgi:hypothetical protein
MRGGLFSLRRLPTNQAEREEEAKQNVTASKNITKLNLDSDSSPRN